MTPNYNPQQIIFALNSIANTPSGQHGSVKQIEAYASRVIKEILANDGVKELIGEWDLVWGPMVFQAPHSTVADNAMYVAQSVSNPREYVVAISGTNPISAYGWVVEDAKLIPMVDWPYNTGSSVATGKISSGTNTGMTVLMSQLQDNGKTLSQFLGDQISGSRNPLSVTVTGHSLGGALSPAVALALLDTQGTEPGWDPKGKSKIAVQPSAGPTPGNDVWRNYYDGRLGSATDRLWNKIDVVPHAWQLSMLDQIPTLYVPKIPASGLVEKLVKLAELNSKLAGDMQQICPNTKGLPGVVDTSIDVSLKDFEVLLETFVANGVIDKLDISDSLKGLIKHVVDRWIKHINTGDESQKSTTYLHADSLWSKLKGEGESILESHWVAFENFIDFLMQAAYQHTTAYSNLLDVNAFSDIVDSIKN